MLYENIDHIPFREKYDKGIVSFKFEGVRWKLIDEYPRYYVSEYGDVVSLIKDRPLLMKPWRSTSKNYKYVGLSVGNGTYIKTTVHSLVAKAFCKNSNGGTVVRHYDDDPDNNYYKNLKWGTQRDNRLDSIRNETEFHKSVYCLENDTDYRSGAIAANDLGLSRSTICLLCKRKISNANGYHVCYADDKEKMLRSIEEWTAEKTNYKPLKAVNSKTGETLYFKSRVEAAETLGIPECGISSVIHGRIKHTHGWSFYDGVEEENE